MKRWLFLGLLLLWPTILFAQSASGYNFGINLTPPDTDLSYIYLSNMFGTVDGVLYGTGSQLLGQLFGVFNSGILVLGGIIVLYTFFIGTLRTAHEGETLGKEWSSIWIPLRVVLGISLLIPKQTGYSFIQILMMWIIVKGIGVADSLWNTALNYLYSGGIVISQNYAGKGSVNTMPMVETSSKLLRSLTCVQMLQAEFTRYRQYQITKGISPITPPPNFQADITKAINASTNGTNPRVQFPTSNYYGTNGVCGSLTWTDVADQLPPQLQNDPGFMASWTGNNSRTDAVSTTVSTLFGSANAIVNNYLIRANNPLAGIPLGQLNNNTWGGPPPNTGSFLIKGTVLSDAAATYYGMMTSTMRLIGEAANNEKTKKAWMEPAKEKGWAMAGAYYFNIVNANEQVASVVDTHTPEAVEPQSDLTNVSGITNYLGGASSPYVLQLQTLINGTSTSDNYIVGSDSRFITDAKTNGGVQSYGSSNSTSAGGAQAKSAAGGVSSSMGGFLGNLSKSESSGINPIVGIATFGDQLVTMSFVVMLLMMLIGFGITIGLGAIPFCSVGAAGVSIVTSITGFLVPVFGAVMVTGLTMSFYIPMIPFILFSFGVIGWFIAVVEAILAAPLVALGISHPEGSNPILGKADPAVGLMINVFFRPTFMIFGLLFGMMVTYVGLWLVNQGFGYAFSQATATATDPFKPLACIIIYTSIAIQIIQKGFSLIHVIPDQVLRWINMRVEGMGGEAQAEQAIRSGVESGSGETGKSMEGATTGSGETGSAIGATKKAHTEDAKKALDQANSIQDAGKTAPNTAVSSNTESGDAAASSSSTPAAEGSAAAGSTTADTKSGDGAGSATENSGPSGSGSSGNTPSAS
ncbi:MAG: type IVB secretion system protein DotA [Gammaproteobacteria bacterium]|nr:type IVB secretion system protein DotA [Gammaproteobacteria bacterium]